jgi:hypothetical protein
VTLERRWIVPYRECFPRFLLSVSKYRVGHTLPRQHRRFRERSVAFRLQNPQETGCREGSCRRVNGHATQPPRVRGNQAVSQEARELHTVAAAQDQPSPPDCSSIERERQPPSPVASLHIGRQLKVAPHIAPLAHSLTASMPSHDVSSSSRTSS